jgi:formylglycine-generating enzyme required for sulfatase activity
MKTNTTVMNSTVTKKGSVLRATLLSFAVAMMGSTTLFGNNITVGTPTLTGRDVSAGANNAANFTMVQFTLSWDNSWRTTVPNNWDAAWVFVKFRLGTTDYRSAPGATNSGTTITVHNTRGLRVGMPVFVNSGTGAFPAGTVITAVNSSTTFTVSSAPTTALSNNAVVRAERIWEHAWLNNTGHAKGSLGATLSIQAGLLDESAAFDPVTNPAMGAYFYRSANGTGTCSTANAQLRWNYAAQGILDNDAVEIQVHAIETVYVPTESYSVDEDGFAESLLLQGIGTNGSTSIIDSSVFGRTVTRVGNPTINASESPFAGTSSISFNGSSDYLSVPANADFDFGSGDFTMEAWVKPTTVSGFRNVMAIAYGAGIWYQYGCALLMNNGQFLFDIYNGCGSTSSYCNVQRVGTGGATFTANNWYHVAITRSVNDFRLFVNGVQQGTTINFTNAITSGGTPYIGHNPSWTCNPCSNSSCCSGLPSPFPGFMKDVRIIKGVNLYSSNFTPPGLPYTHRPSTLNISSENSLTVGGTNSSNLMLSVSPTTANDFSTAATQTLPANYPKGYNGFYSMKYEISQRQWMDFFNTLTTVQRDARDITAISTAPVPGKNSDAQVNRNNISWTSGNATLIGGTFGDVACNFLNWADGAAYAAWAGLRPMSELEYEKAARGPIQPLKGRTSAEILYTSLVQTTAISSGGLNTEVPSPTTANAVFGNNGSVQGPLRVGALATSTSNRAKAGASFWGIMDLSGNLREQVVTLGNTDGRNFVPALGNGVLSRLGNATVSTWPGLVSGEITGATGSGLRGGSWFDASTSLVVSNRLSSNTAVSARSNANGFRAARNLPTSAVQ